MKEETAVIGGQMMDLFLSFGDPGMLVALAFVVLLDGTGLPTVPEMWLVLFFGAHPDTLAWGAAIAIVASVAGLGGILIQYSLVKLARLPRKIRHAMKSYAEFLVLHDERLLLMNKAAPMIPYSGAFVAVLGWDLRRAMGYSFLGSLGKTSMIIALTYLTYGGLAREIADWISIVVVGCVMCASLLTSVVLRKRYGLLRAS